MAKRFCEKLIDALARELRPRFTSEEVNAFADYDQRWEAAPSILETLKGDPDWSARLDRISEDPKGQLSAVREALHLMADLEEQHAAKAVAASVSRQEELVA